MSTQASADLVHPYGFSRGRSRDAVTGAVAIVATLCFYWFRNNRSFFYAEPLPVALLALVAAFAFSFVRYGLYPRLFSALTRATALGVLAYLILEPSDLTLVYADKADLFAYVDHAYWVAVAVAALGVWRPSFIFPAAYYALSARYASNAISGLSFPLLDIGYILEMAQFLALGACGLAVLSWAQARSANWRVGPALSLIDHEQLAFCLAFIAIGFHLGNYFWSGYQKVAVVGPHLWTWVVENQTQNMIPVALKKGVLPSGAYPALTQWMSDTLGTVVVLSNLLVVLAQLFAILAPLRMRWLFIAALAYDLLHIGIYLVSGLLFWPWIWNNGSIMVAIRGYRDWQIGWLPRLCCILAIVAGGSPHLGRSARLAWFDVLDIKIPKIQVEAPDGTWINVPSSFFLSHSYEFSAGTIDMAFTQGHYQPSHSGSAGYGRAKTSGQCVQPGPVQTPESPEAREKRLQRLSKFLLAHHKKMLAREAEFGRYSYYLRLHHRPSIPWLFSEFNQLDLSRVRRYRLVTQSVCLRLSEGRVEERELKRDEVIFDVR